MPISLRRRARGLTLIEIIVVITIISLLMTAVGVYAMGVLTTSRRDLAKQDIRTALTALDMFRARRGRYPTTSEGFQALVQIQALKKLPKDPWGGELTYALVDGEPVVTSLGRDQKTGGLDDDADSSSRELDD